MLTCDRLRELLDYDSETGVFSQRISYQGKGARWKSGRVSGSISKQSGYLTLRLDGKNYQAHRCAWMHVTGTWPTAEIDHRDGDRLNNRMSNLRDVSRQNNAQNIQRVRSDSSTGVKGVQLDRRNGRPCAQIRTAGKDVFLGSFDTVEQASEAYLAAKNALHVGWAKPPELVVGEYSEPTARRMRCDSKSGFPGVSLHTSGRWVARANRKHLGTFDTAEAAHAAFLKAKSY